MPRRGSVGSDVNCSSEGNRGLRRRETPVESENQVSGRLHQPIDKCVRTEAESRLEGD